MQNKLTEMQNARRDLIIAVANVGGNALQLEDETTRPTIEPPPVIPPVTPSAFIPQRRYIR